MNKEINLINKDDIVINNNTSSEESKEEEILEENQDNNDFKNENLNLENSLESFIENFYSDKIQISKLFFTLGSATSRPSVTETYFTVSVLIFSLYVTVTVISWLPIVPVTTAMSGLEFIYDFNCSFSMYQKLCPL